MFLILDKLMQWHRVLFACECDDDWDKFRGCSEISPPSCRADGGEGPLFLLSYEQLGTPPSPD